MRGLIFCCLILSTLAFSRPVTAQNLGEVKLYHGLYDYTISAIAHTKPPYVSLNDVLLALGMNLPRTQDEWLLIELNHRQVFLHIKDRIARYKQKSLPLPLRSLENRLFVRVDALALIFSDFFGKKMIYEPTSHSIHVPKNEEMTVTLRMRQVGDGYRLVLIYSQPLAPPEIQKNDRNLAMKIKASPIIWDHSHFEANEAVTGYEIYDNLPDNTSEIVFKIGEKAKKYNVEPFTPDNPRTIIKITGDFESEDIADGFARESAIPGIRRIVIDPGHGGIDKGAVGPTGLEEKDVTLELAKKLKTHLESEGHYQVLLTRSEDVLLSLKTRTGIANHNKADLFISIHLNAIRAQNARGSETYYLSMDANDGFDTTHYEEFSEQLESSDLEEAPSDELSIMLWDLAQTKHVEDSFRIAKYIQEELNNLAGTRSRGVKQAPLKVLKGATMPAVLIETAFISDSVEEAKLKNPIFKDRIVEAVSRAVRRYDQDVQRRSAKPAQPLSTEGRLP